MKVFCDGIKDGWIEDRFGCKGDVFVNGMPGLSVPLRFEDCPPSAKSFAVVMDDYDAIAVGGFNWIHWTLCDLKRDHLDEGESHSSKDFVEGCNSWHSMASPNTVEEATGYGGPAPPDKAHRYTVTVFALDTELGLKRGFLMNELYFAMQGHIIAQDTVVGLYGPKE